MSATSLIRFIVVSDQTATTKHEWYADAVKEFNSRVTSGDTGIFLGNSWKEKK